MCQQQDLVTILKAELLRAMGEIMALKDGKSSLKEQVGQLHDQLKDKDALIRKETKKRCARCKAHMDCLVELTECQAT
ncbi:unnamed protein product [Pleuronectes platessa]|uniref:Uncharacterized protein n=1 Tax=Pleuronectes platessa TaxID=8262 RepID=A0A9N7Z6G0_PLEPL|nr:unnamed protein product [Pleuronectes platessa]